jgi:hypothetical protein
MDRSKPIIISEEALEKRRARTRANSQKWRERWPEKHTAAVRKREDKMRSLIATIKVTSGCVDCGYNENPSALQFDHVRGVKLFDVSQGRVKGEKLLLDEIDKCEVRCANCHAIVTAERRYAGGQE